jgi:sarcosine oxidase
MDYEIGIVGVGAMGSMAMWQLAKRGVRVIGFEQFGLCDERSASSGETRMFRTAYKNGPHYVPLLQAAQKLWRELEADTGCQIVQQNGFATVGVLGSDDLDRVMACAQAMNLDLEVLSAAAASKRFPAMAVRPSEVALFDKQAGLLKPERAVIAAATHAEALGGTLRRNCTVLAIKPGANSVLIRTDRGNVEVGSVILTAGAWSSRFLTRGLVTPHRVALHWYLARTPALFAPDVFPSHIRTIDGAGICLFSSQDATMVKAAVAGSLGVLPNPLDAATAVAWDEKTLSQVITEFYPDLWPDPVRSRSYADGFTPDKDGLIGRLPDESRVVVAAGFSAQGFKLASAIGAALADIATLGVSSLPIGHLDLARFDVHLEPGRKSLQRP